MEEFDGLVGLCIDDLFSLIRYNIFSVTYVCPFVYRRLRGAVISLLVVQQKQDLIKFEKVFASDRIQNALLAYNTDSRSVRQGWNASFASSLAHRSSLKQRREINLIIINIALKISAMYHVSFKYSLD